jgi:hypothetical protein
MGTLKVDLEDKLLEAYKRKVMEVYGYKRGALKLATIALVKRWLSERPVNWSSLRGSLRIKGSSVKLQHKAWRNVD